MIRIKALVEYLGTDFAGWQIQPQVATVQGAIEEALQTVLRRPVRIASAGRTDTGVHALGQVIAFDVEPGVDLYRLQGAVNALTPRAISVRNIEVVADDFDPRRHALSRTYEYVIDNSRPPSPFWQDRAWNIHHVLDLDVLNTLAKAVEGKHDFAGFRAADCGSNSSVRRVLESSWARDQDLIVYTICANAFLKQMVRVLVGSMVDVALGKLGEETFLGLLSSAGNRTDAGITAPAAGLTMVRVSYD